jgi:hypothetical protein
MMMMMMLVIRSPTAYRIKKSVIRVAKRIWLDPCRCGQTKIMPLDVLGPQS